ncbi:MAG TPA: hypothetical protein DEZ09_04275, partial [Holosporales bacterium]|nr:hypothetical protein [Holosporales bacterium]
MKRNTMSWKGGVVLFWMGAASADTSVSTLNSSANQDAVNKLMDRPTSQVAFKKSPKYTLSVSETFLKNKNSFSSLRGKASGNITSVAFNAKENNTWDWGVAYLFMQNKISTFSNGGVQYGTNHGLMPYVIYSLNPNVHVDVLGGGITSRLRISETDNSVFGVGVAHSKAGFLQTGLTVKKTFGKVTPSFHVGFLYYNSRTGAYSLTNGIQNNAAWTHFVKGRAGVRLSFNFDPVRLYVRGGTELLLRRSSNYVIQTWNGWSEVVLRKW